MKIKLEIDLDEEDLEHELSFILDRARSKILAQLSRPPALCTAPEDADLLRNRQGQRVGMIKLS